jgi:SAM-dependent methyltransferase
VTDPRVAPRAARFGDVADRYERARPLYPESALSELAARCGVGPGTAVLDLGAGTGKLTRQLVAVGADVVALEPAAGMRRRLEAEVPGVPVLDGTAEDIPLPDASMEVITAGQAFHWFDTHRALDEIARVLRPAGWLALLWNERPASGWAAGLWDLRTELTGGTRTYPGEGWTEVLAADDRFGPRTSSRHDVAVTTTADAELADSESRSCVHVIDAGRRRDVLDRLRGFLEAHPETARRRRLTYTRPCTLHLCQRAR